MTFGKSFLVAGGLVIASTLAASAADMLPPPPPPMAPPPPAEFSGWYLRGDVGVAKQKAKTWSHGDVTAAPGGRFINSFTGDAAFAGVGVGYQFNNWLRFDVTGEVRSSASIGATDTYNWTCAFVGGSCGAIGQVVPRSNIWTGQREAIVGLANVYVDLGTWHGLTPFIGAGIGGSWNHVFGVKDFDPSEFGGAGFASDTRKWSMAYALHAGLAYSVTSNVKLEMGYRYLNMGTASIGTLTCLPLGNCNPTGRTGKIADNEAHEIKLGMRWLFADYAPAPAFPPVIRKY